MKTKIFKFMTAKAITVVHLMDGEAIIHIDCPVTHLNIAEAEAYAKLVMEAVSYAKKGKNNDKTIK